ncbi:MAG: aromatic-L-amino-acid decarboxylase [Rhodothermales bacterium]
MLELTSEAMQRLGDEVMSVLVAHRADTGGLPVSRVLSREEADALFEEPLPLSGTDPVGLVQALTRDVFANISHVDHPRFFAFVPGPGNFVATMGTALAAGHNVFAGTWLGGSAAARLEQTVIDWLLDAVGFPTGGGGLFVSGGSMANLTALGGARKTRLGSHAARGVVYYSSQTHSAVERALRVLGFADSQMRKIDADPTAGLDISMLARAVAEDREADRKPFCVVANAGTTNTGAVDPLDAIADLCESENLWMHVDGAYGAAAVFGERAQHALRGLGRADSIALDPHKWLFQPFECGCLLVRDAAALRDAYAIHPEYMRDTLREDEEINFCEYGVQLSRSFRALSLWMTLKTFGATNVGQAIDHAFGIADYAAEVIRAMDGWEMVTPPSMAILTFRFTAGPEDKLDEWNAGLVKALRESGVAMVSSTLLGGKYVIRLCPTNPRTTCDDIDLTLTTLDELAHVYR